MRSSSTMGSPITMVSNKSYGQSYILLALGSDPTLNLQIFTSLSKYRICCFQIAEADMFVLTSQWHGV